MRWFIRLLNTLRTGRLRRDLDREQLFHIAERTDQLRAEGFGADEARRRARVQFGSPAAQIERTRDVDISSVLDGTLRNLRYACRSLRRAPGFTITVVLTLGAGIGANAAVFSALDAVLLKPLPFPNTDRIVRLAEVRPGAGETAIAPVRLADWHRMNSTFEVISGYFTNDAVDTTGDLPERLRQAVVAPRFFEVLGVTPVAGRSFTAAEHRFGGPTVAQISHQVWQARGAPPNLVGSQVRSGGLSVTIVGILPPFPFPDMDIHVWGAFPSDAPFAQSRQPAWLSGLGRLKPGVTIEQARADLAAVQARLATEYPSTDRDIGVAVEPLKNTFVGPARGSLWLLYGAVSVLLLIACANIAALMLSRTAERAHEIAIRSSLGATRRSVGVQLLTESALLAAAGAAVGVAMARFTIGAFTRMAPGLPRIGEVAIDGRILAYTAATSVICALACGLLPAIGGMRSGGIRAGSTRTLVSSRHSAQWLLVGIQVALSVTLLSGAALLLRSSNALLRVDPGFDGSRVLAFHVAGRFGDPEGLDGLVRRVNLTLDELDRLPGIETSATATLLPGVPGQQQEEVGVVEGRADTESRIVVERRDVSPSYFAALGIPVIDGTLCRRPDAFDAPTEVMVNRALAARYFPGRNPLGLHLSSGTRPMRIAGIVADARERGVDQDPVPTVYGCASASTATPWFLVRTAGDPMTAIRDVRVAIKTLAPMRPVYDIAPLEERIGGAYAQNRLRTFVLVLFAVTALVLACLGIYGTLSYVAGRRRREMGLRVALGARRHTILTELIARALRVVGVACAVGLLLALAATQSLSGMLFGVSASDPATFAGVILVVIVVAAAAAFVPALRTARIDPIRALQED